MARTIAQIQQEIIDQKNADAHLVELTNNAPDAIWLLITYVVAVCQWTLEKLFGAHKSEVSNIISNMKAHKPQWYVEKAKAFQLGRSLIPETDLYDNSGLTSAQIDASKIIKYAAAPTVRKKLRLKVAKVVNGDLAPLTTSELSAFAQYMDRVKDAGVWVEAYSAIGDSLKMYLKVYYDPMILDGSGARLDGTAATPVLDAIVAFLQNQPFNGLYVLAKQIDALQAVEGVVVPEIVSAQTSYGLRPYEDIITEYLPDAGYLRIANPSTDLIIEYIAHEPV